VFIRWLSSILVLHLSIKSGITVYPYTCKGQSSSSGLTAPTNSIMEEYGNGAMDFGKSTYNRRGLTVQAWLMDGGWVLV
jgi:hypothetical protein